eukprot:13527165-Heterocapsa_arctica.AAC.1
MAARSAAAVPAAIARPPSPTQPTSRRRAAAGSQGVGSQPQERGGSGQAEHQPVGGDGPAGAQPMFS